MWELIRANQRRSVVLLSLLGAILVGCGSAIAYGLDPAALPIGAIGALVIWAILLLTSFAGGESVLLSQANAREVDAASAPQLFNVVEEMKIASGLSQMPKVYVIDSPTPNAFAVGINEKRAAVAVTTGLLAKLRRDELQGVVAHEIAHIKHRDTMFMTLAGVTLGAIVLMADLYFRGMRFGGYRGRSSSKDSGQAAALLAIIAVVLAILAPLLARMLYFACSRQREYLADAGGAQFTRYPEALASALEKISGLQATKGETSRVLAPMYIVNPLQAYGGRSSVFSTHPPTETRVRILRGMAGQFSLASYDQAFHAAGGKGRLIPSAALAEGDSAAVAPRPATAVEPPPIPAWREAKETIHRLNAMRVVSCGCGLKLKLPPGFDKPRVECPRCGRNVVVAA